MGCGSSVVDGDDKYNPQPLDISSQDDAATAHAYIASAERRRGSNKIASSKEPSQFVTSVSRQCSVVRAFLINGVTSDIDQYEEEIKVSVAPFHSHRRQAVQNWLTCVDVTLPATSESYSPWTSTSNPGSSTKDAQPHPPNGWLTP